MEAVGGFLARSGGSGDEPSMFQNPGVTMPDALLALGVLIAAGTIAGLVPAQRAVAVQPVVALRSD